MNLDGTHLKVIKHMVEDQMGYPYFSWSVASCRKQVKFQILFHLKGESNFQ